MLGRDGEDGELELALVAAAKVYLGQEPRVQPFESDWIGPVDAGPVESVLPRRRKISPGNVSFRGCSGANWPRISTKPTSFATPLSRIWRSVASRAHHQGDVGGT
jgi:hypothetical protein